MRFFILVFLILGFSLSYRVYSESMPDQYAGLEAPLKTMEKTPGNKLDVREKEGNPDPDGIALPLISAIGESDIPSIIFHPSIQNEERDFYRRIHGANLGMIEMRRVALEKSSNASVLALSDRMARDYTFLNKNLENMAQRYDINFSAFDSSFSADVRQLFLLPENEFNKVFLTIADQKLSEEIQVLKTAYYTLPEFSSLSRWSQKMIPLLEQYRELVQSE